MSRKKVKGIYKVFALLAVLVIVTVFGSCGKPEEDSFTAAETEEIVVVIPSDGRSIISSLVYDYKNIRPDVSVKVVNIGGTAEEIHSFCVSTLMDEKFNADLLIIDDIWLSEFVSAGLVSDISDISEYYFIPAAEAMMMNDGKTYGIPIYADAMADFKKYENTSGHEIYFEDDINDISAYIRSGIDKGVSADSAYQKYLQILKTDKLSDFIENDIEVMHGWLSHFDEIQKYYPKLARNIEIRLNENSLIKTKLAIINSKSKSKQAALDIVKYLLTDESQNEIMKNITSIPVITKSYSEPFILDRFPYLNGLSGENFRNFPCLKGYNLSEINLSKLIQSGAKSSDVVAAFDYLEK